MVSNVCECCGQVIVGTAVVVSDGPPKLARPAMFTPEFGDKICGLLAQGLSLKAICEMEGMPEPASVFRWRRRFPSFSLAYASAREDAADAMADEIMAISDDRSDDWKQDPETGVWKPDHDHIQRAKLRVDARKWIAAKLKPATYGDRVEANIKGEMTTRNINIDIDASHLPSEAREALRAALLPRLVQATKDDEAEDS